jgi:CRP-like cAMP-binding protein/tetratricopeptide (TPR) repeat protein
MDATAKRLALPMDARNVAAAHGTNARLTLLESEHAQAQSNAQAVGDKSSVASMVRLSEESQLHEIEMGVSIAVDDARKRRLDRQLSTNRVAPTPLHQRTTSSTGDPFRHGTSPLGVSRMSSEASLRRVPGENELHALPPLARPKMTRCAVPKADDSRPHVIALAAGASSKADLRRFARAADATLHVSVIDVVDVAVAAVTDTRKFGARCALVIAELGSEASRVLFSAMRTSGRRVPVIVCSTDFSHIADRPDDLLEMRRTASSGVDTVVERPFDNDKLVARCLGLIRTSTAAQSAYEEVRGGLEASKVTKLQRRKEVYAGQFGQADGSLESERRGREGASPGEAVRMCVENGGSIVVQALQHLVDSLDATVGADAVPPWGRPDTSRPESTARHHHLGIPLLAEQSKFVTTIGRIIGPFLAISASTGMVDWAWFSDVQAVDTLGKATDLTYATHVATKAASKALGIIPLKPGGHRHSITGQPQREFEEPPLPAHDLDVEEREQLIERVSLVADYYLTGLLNLRSTASSKVAPSKPVMIALREQLDSSSEGMFSPMPSPGGGRSPEVDPSGGVDPDDVEANALLASIDPGHVSPGHRSEVVRTRVRPAISKLTVETIAMLDTPLSPRGETLTRAADEFLCTAISIGSSPAVLCAPEWLQAATEALFRGGSIGTDGGIVSGPLPGGIRLPFLAPGTSRPATTVTQVPGSAHHPSPSLESLAAVATADFDAVQEAGITFTLGDGGASETRKDAENQALSDLKRALRMLAAPATSVPASETLRPMTLAEQLDALDGIKENERWSAAAQRWIHSAVWEESQEMEVTDAIDQLDAALFPMKKVSSFMSSSSSTSGTARSARTGRHTARKEEPTSSLARVRSSAKLGDPVTSRSRLPRVPSQAKMKKAEPTLPAAWWARPLWDALKLARVSSGEEGLPLLTQLDSPWDEAVEVHTTDVLSSYGGVSLLKRVSSNNATEAAPQGEELTLKSQPPVVCVRLLGSTNWREMIPHQQIAQLGKRFPSKALDVLADQAKILCIRRVVLAMAFRIRCRALLALKRSCGAFLEVLQGDWDVTANRVTSKIRALQVSRSVDDAIKAVVVANGGELRFRPDSREVAIAQALPCPVRLDELQGALFFVPGSIPALRRNLHLTSNEEHRLFNVAMAAKQTKRLAQRAQELRDEQQTLERAALQASQTELMRVTRSLPGTDNSSRARLSPIQASEAVPELKASGSGWLLPPPELTGRVMGDAWKAWLGSEILLSGTEQEPPISVVGVRSKAYPYLIRGSSRNRSLPDADEGALACFAKATLVNPRCHVSRCYKAIALIRLKRFPEALKELDMAVGWQPGVVAYRYNRALARVACGDVRGAIGDLNVVLATHDRKWQQATSSGTNLRVRVDDHGGARSIESTIARAMAASATSLPSADEDEAVDSDPLLKKQSMGIEEVDWEAISSLPSVVSALKRTTAPGVLPKVVRDQFRHDIDARLHRLQVDAEEKQIEGGSTDLDSLAQDDMFASHMKELRESGSIAGSTLSIGSRGGRDVHSMEQSFALGRPVTPGTTSSKGTGGMASTQSLLALARTVGMDGASKLLSARTPVEEKSLASQVYGEAAILGGADQSRSNQSQRLKRVTDLPPDSASLRLRALLRRRIGQFEEAFSDYAAATRIDQVGHGSLAGSERSQDRIDEERSAAKAGVTDSLVSMVLEHSKSPPKERRRSSIADIPVSARAEVERDPRGANASAGVEIVVPEAPASIYDVVGGSTDLFSCIFGRATELEMALAAPRESRTSTQLGILTEAVRKLPLLRNCPPEQTLNVAKSLGVKKYRKSDLIVAELSEPAFLGFIVTGSVFVKLTVGGSGGISEAARAESIATSEVTVDVLRSGDSFNELGMLWGAKHVLGISAKSDTVVVLTLDAADTFRLGVDVLILQELDRKRQVISRTGAFSGLSGDELTQLASISHVRQFPENSVIVKQATQPDCLCILSRGIATVHRSADRLLTINKAIRKTVAELSKQNFGLKFHHNMIKEAGKDVATDGLPEGGVVESEPPVSDPVAISEALLTNSMSVDQIRDAIEQQVSSLSAPLSDLIGNEGNPWHRTAVQAHRRQLQQDLLALLRRKLEVVLAREVELSTMIDEERKKTLRRIRVRERATGKAVDAAQVSQQLQDLESGVEALAEEDSVKVQTLYPPSLFGEHAITDPFAGFSPATILTETQCEVLMISKRKVDQTMISQAVREDIASKSPVYPPDSELRSRRAAEKGWEEYKSGLLAFINKRKWPVSKLQVRELPGGRSVVGPLPKHIK